VNFGGFCFVLGLSPSCWDCRSCKFPYIAHSVDHGLLFPWLMDKIALPLCYRFEPFNDGLRTAGDDYIIRQHMQQIPRWRACRNHSGQEQRRMVRYTSHKVCFT